MRKDVRPLATPARALKFGWLHADYDLQTESGRHGIKNRTLGTPPSVAKTRVVLSSVPIAHSHKTAAEK